MIKNNQGLTLLEVLLSITILAIVLAFFINLFPTAAKFNLKTSETLTGINLGKEKIVILENIVRDDKHKAASEKFFTLSNDTLNITTNTDTNSKFKLLNTISLDSSQSERLILQTEDNLIHSTIIINRNPDFIGFNNLYRVLVDVHDPDTKDITHVYGYLLINK